MIVKYITIESAKKLNFFLAHHRVSKYYSLRIILYQENLDHERYCKYTLSKYVQAKDNPNNANTNTARILDCLYLYSSDSK